MPIEMYIRGVRLPVPVVLAAPGKHRIMVERQMNVVQVDLNLVKGRGEEVALIRRRRGCPANEIDRARHWIWSRNQLLAVAEVISAMTSRPIAQAPEYIIRTNPSALIFAIETRFIRSIDS